MQGLPGTGISYTIPARAIEAFLGKAVLLVAEPPSLSYRRRKQEHNWTIPIWIVDPKAPELAVEVAFGQGRSRRSFRATGVADARTRSPFEPYRSIPGRWTALT